MKHALIFLALILFTITNVFADTTSITWGDKGFSYFKNTSKNGYMVFDRVAPYVDRIQILGPNDQIFFDDVPRQGQIICLPPGQYKVKQNGKIPPGQSKKYLNYRFVNQAPYRPINYNSAIKYGSNKYKYPQASYWKSGYVYQKPGNNNHKHDNHKHDNHKHDNHKHDNHKHDNHKHDNHKHDNHKHDNHKHDNHKHDNHKHDNHKHGNDKNKHSNDKNKNKPGNDKHKPVSGNKDKNKNKH